MQRSASRVRAVQPSGTGEKLIYFAIRTMTHEILLTPDVLEKLIRNLAARERGLPGGALLRRFASI